MAVGSPSWAVQSNHSCSASPGIRSGLWRRATTNRLWVVACRDEGREPRGARPGAEVQCRGAAVPDDEVPNTSLRPRYASLRNTSLRVVACRAMSTSRSVSSNGFWRTATTPGACSSWRTARSADIRMTRYTSPVRPRRQRVQKAQPVHSEHPQIQQHQSRGPRLVQQPQCLPPARCAHGADVLRLEGLDE